MATHSGIPAWKIPWTEEPGRLYIFRGVRRVGHDRAHTHTHSYLQIRKLNHKGANQLA